MKIDFFKLRSVLLKYFNSDSLVLNSINGISENPCVNTICINEKGEILYNSEFMEKIRNENDLFQVLFHELSHSLFDSFKYKEYDMSIVNIASDMLINSYIYFNFNPTDDTFFEYYYPDDGGVNSILRPKSKRVEKKYSKLYKNVYCIETYGQSGNLKSTYDVIEVIKRLINDKEKTYDSFIGSHSKSTVNDDITDKLVNDIKNGKIKNYSNVPLKDCGSNSLVNTLFKSLVESKETLKLNLLSKFLNDKTVGRFNNFVKRLERRKSCISSSFSKRDIIMISNGIAPLFYNTDKMHDSNYNKGELIVYLDVSGSVGSYIDYIRGIIKNISKNINKIYLFSNIVAEINIRDFLNGKIETTYGTDFDCIAKNIIENKFKKVLVFTDGYARLDSNYIKMLSDTNLKGACVLFNRNDANNNSLVEDLKFELFYLDQLLTNKKRKGN